MEKLQKFEKCVYLPCYNFTSVVPKVLHAASEEEDSKPFPDSEWVGLWNSGSVDDQGAVSRDASDELETGPTAVVQRPSENVAKHYRERVAEATCAIVSGRRRHRFFSEFITTRLRSIMTRLPPLWQQVQGNIPGSPAQYLADTLPNLTVNGGGTCL